MRVREKRQSTDERRINLKILKRMLSLILILLIIFTSSLGEMRTIGIGDEGQEVLRIKERLQELRYIKKSSLSSRFTEKNAAAVKEFQRQNSLPETGVIDDTTWQILFSESAVKKPYPRMKQLAEQAARTEPDWPERDTEGFLLSGEEYIYENDREGLWVYLNRRLQVTVIRCSDASIPLVWFETDIRTREGEVFRTAMTDEKHPGKKFQYPYIISRDEKFVLGFSDDFYATRMGSGETVGIIIRNGKIISSDTNRKETHHLPNLDMMAQFSDGHVEVFECNEITADELCARGAYNVFSFGPILIRDGEINEMLYTYYRSTEPRHALGMISPHHYLLLSVEGRTKESKGTVLQRIAEMMQDRGVTQALNLDGGNTMALIFRGRMLNKLATYKRKKFVRTVTSLIGIGYTEEQAE